ncbi:MAG: penicillin-binding protein 2 [Candidatus Latescibacteria bacterium]|nr:penicillin-binding protein 2 [Candidatus Latescibacterota bacterium]NIO27284.1 penicillin-binding protein 2 [Candidatus Latescibacterota bacterium]NIO54808.1 penicillin-binding protein 2 [Candidatus Latescibacterota bacterium]NIT00891.1 penicillin-binding protein 2 [Candidatus Latescibacterota bacterium]NIT37814.1 penicillin-binding protein 2 [Candidatus Latescibacterota bacterium]
MGKRASWDERLGRTRRRWLQAFAVFFFLVLLIRLFSLQAVEHAGYAKDAEKNQFQRLRIPAPRGLIVDRNGEVLVDNVPRFDVVVPWKREESALMMIRKLSNFLTLDSTAVFARFDIWAKKNAGLPFPVVKDADKLIISAVRENVDLFPQLRVETRARRRYRKGLFASHLLGYVAEISDEELANSDPRDYQAGDVIGKTGLELYCEEHLHGIHGYRVVQVNAWGTVLGDVDGPSIAPRTGRTVKLTIDAKIQAYLEERLAREGTGAVVMMNVHDGAVIAAVSIPRFDPNSFAAGINQEEWDRLHNEESKPLFNRYLQATYPPGSTLKVISASVALENELVDPEELLVYCTGAHRFGNRFFKCWREEGHGWMDLHNAVVQSCDSYFFKFAETLDVDELAEAARAFGLGSRTGIELRGEARGLVPDRKYYDNKLGKGEWTQGHVLNNVIGQGEFLSTLLQMCRVAAVIANGGYLVSPHVIHSIGDDYHVVHPKREIGALSKRTIQFLKRAMRGVVEDKDGTAHWCRVDGLQTAGKTGTSQNPHGKDHAWFIGYAPANDPVIAIAVLIENAGHGGEFAAPLARDAYRKYFEKQLAEQKPPVGDQTGLAVGLGGRHRESN